MPQEYLDQYFREDVVRAPNVAPDAQALAPQALTPHDIVPMLIGSTVEAIERELVLQTLTRCEGSRTRAARLLGVSVRTLRNKIRQYAGDGLDIPAPS